MKGKLRTAGWSIVFLALSFLSLSWGTVEITPGEALVYTWQAVLGVESGSISSDVVQYLRLPHFVLAFAVGWGLALCGTVMQAVMRNPLADPYLLGISSGAGLGAVIAMALGADAYLGVHGVSMCAFLGAVGISLAILFVASAAGKGDSLTLLLVGFAMNALCSAALSFIIQAMADTHKTKSVQFWLMGNIMADSWTDIGILAGIIAAGSIFFMEQRRILDLMLIGDELSLSMGRNLAVYRKIYILVVAVLVGSIVYVAGMVGFIGLIIPHMVRMAAGSGHKSLIPLAGLAGGCFLAWADVLGRNLIMVQNSLSESWLRSAAHLSLHGCFLAGSMEAGHEEMDGGYRLHTPFVRLRSRSGAGKSGIPITNIQVENYFNLGENVQYFSKVPSRVLVIGASQTETLLDMGVEDSILWAVKYEDDKKYPIKDCNQAAFQRLNFLPRQQVTMERVLDLAPDLIISEESWFSKNRLGSTEYWNAKGIHTLVSLNTTGPAKTNQPETVEKEIKYIRDLGAVYHKEEQAEKIITATMERFEEVRQKVKGQKSPKVMILDLLSSTISYGRNKIAGDIASKLGGIVPNTTAAVSDELIIKENPDIVFVITYDDAETRLARLRNKKLSVI